MTAKVFYSDNLVMATQAWSTLSGRTLTVGAPDSGDLSVYNVCIEVEARAVRVEQSDVVRARVWGVEPNGDGTGGAFINPGSIIRSLLTDFLEFTAAEIDSTSFDEAIAYLQGTRYGFWLGERTASEELLGDLAYQSRCWLFEEALPYKLLYRQTFLGASVRSITDTGVTGFIEGSTKLRPQGLENVFNRIVVKWDPDPLVTSEPYRNISIATDEASQTKYGEKELIVEGTAIRDAVSARNLAEFLCAQHKEIRYQYTFSSYLGNCNLERGDVVDITDAKWALSAAKGEVISVRYIPGRVTPPGQDDIPHTMMITVLLEPYRWDWSESGESRFNPGEAGSIFSAGAWYAAVTDSGGTLQPTLRVPSLSQESDAAILYLRGRVASAQDLGTASANPLWWDAINERMCFALSDNTIVMALDRAGNLRVKTRVANAQDLTFAGAANEVNSDGSTLWINAGGVRVLEWSNNAVRVRTRISEAAGTMQIL